MFKFLVKSLLVFSVIVASSPNSIGSDRPNGYDSLSVKGKFSNQASGQIFSTVEKAIDPIRVEYLRRHGKLLPNKGLQFNGIYFTASKPDNLHISIAIVEPTNSQQQLRQQQVTKLEEISAKYLNITQGYPGAFYGLYLFAHGYDANGQELHYHYSDSSKAANTINKSKYGFGAQGSKLTHAHVVLRFGTNPNPSDGQKGKLSQVVEPLLADITNNKISYGFQDSYENSHSGFTSHLTVATIKGFVGKINLQNICAIDASTVLNIYGKIHQEWLNSNSSQVKYNLSEFSMNGVSNNKHYDVVSKIKPSNPGIGIMNNLTHGISNININSPTKLGIILVKEYGQPKYGLNKDCAIFMHQENNSWGFPTEKINGNVNHTFSDVAKSALKNKFGYNTASYIKLISSNNDLALCIVKDNNQTVTNIKNTKGDVCKVVLVQEFIDYLNYPVKGLLSRTNRASINLNNTCISALQNNSQMLVKELNNLFPNANFS